jgi:hypothetical protein
MSQLSPRPTSEQPHAALSMLRSYESPMAKSIVTIAAWYDVSTA